jgi:6-phosphogluconolactonase
MTISRRSARAVILLVALSSTLLAAAAPAEHHGKYLFYVGTYTGEGSKSKGIYAYRFDPDTGEIAELGLAAETTNPSFVALHPNGRFLYAVNEVGNSKGPDSGGVSAFSIDRATGKLTFLNEARLVAPIPATLPSTKRGDMSWWRTHGRQPRCIPGARGRNAWRGFGLHSAFRPWSKS